MGGSHGILHCPQQTQGRDWGNREEESRACQIEVEGKIRARGTRRLAKLACTWAGGINRFGHAEGNPINHADPLRLQALPGAVTFEISCPDKWLLEIQLTTPYSKSGIYLIRFAVPREHQWGFPWSLTIIRANTPVGSLVPYIAFDSDAAAAEFIARKGDDRLSVIEASQLDLSVHFIHASGALVFRSLAELDGWVSNPAAGGGQWKSLPPAGLLSDFVRALKNWRAKHWL